jgi:DNA polymerase
MPKELSIDIETFSSYDISETGVYKYVEAPDFEVLLFAYAFDDEPVQIVDLASGEFLPDEVMFALGDPAVRKCAFNAAFERLCLSTEYPFIKNPAHWSCTMVLCSMLGLPQNLDKAGEVLKIDQQKMKEGKALINFFCKPCKPTKANGERIRNLPHHDPARWELFKQYCIRDVEAERSIRRKLSFFAPSQFEQCLWELDQRINDRGVKVDMGFVNNAIRMYEEYAENITNEAITLTGLANPNSLTQLKEWLSASMAQDVTGLTKKDVSGLLDSCTDDVVSRVLEIRKELGKTSVKKYYAMRAAVCADGRVRGLLQYYGANRTGRWAGRLVQVQNLPQNKINDTDLDLARDLVDSYMPDWVQLFYGNVPDLLSQLIRTAFVAERGTFDVVDFSAIEAVVLAWLSGEQWRLDVFKTHGKIYEASASAMFHVPIEYIVKDRPEYALRQKGKVAELALGYQGGPGALISMGALNMGLREEELKPIVAAWRKANPKIVKLWYAMDEAAKECVASGEPRSVRGGLIQFSMTRGFLRMQLPSGRALYYPSAKLIPGKFGDVVAYKGVHQTTRQWTTTESYGGKFVENAVQAIARDCLAESMVKVATDVVGTGIVLHVHDEIVGESLEGSVLDSMQAAMLVRAPWAKDIPLKAAGYSTTYYKKD